MSTCAKARRLLRFEQHFSSGAEGPGADPLALLHSSRPLSLNEICSALPTQEQAKVCLEAYTTNKHRFHNPFILRNLLRQWDDIWHKPIQKCDPHQIAVYFAACAAAVYGMDTEDFRRAEIFGGLSRSALTRKWGNGAMRALNFGGELCLYSASRPVPTFAPFPSFWCRFHEPPESGRASRYRPSQSLLPLYDGDRGQHLYPLAHVECSVAGEDPETGEAMPLCSHAQRRSRS